MQSAEVHKDVLRRFWGDSVRRAVAARLLSRELTPRADPMEAFTIGLLQDMGVLALIGESGTDKEFWRTHLQKSPAERRRVEESRFGITHDELAVLLVESWHLPDMLAIPIQWHHHAGQCPESFRMRAEISARSELLSYILVAEDLEAAVRALYDRTHITPQRFEDQLVRLEYEVADVGAMMQVDVSDQSRVGSWIEDAMAILRRLHEEDEQRASEALRA